MIDLAAFEDKTKLGIPSIILQCMRIQDQGRALKRTGIWKGLSGRGIGFSAIWAIQTVLSMCWATRVQAALLHP